MNREEYQHLQAEHTFLRQQLATLPATAQLTRLSGEARLRAVERQLTDFQGMSKRARLTFRGRPVVGIHGIFAEFGARAVSVFADAVAKVASTLFVPSAPVGTLPNREEGKLLITGSAGGSFGFELQEHGPSRLDYGQTSRVGDALALTQTPMRSTLGTDDELADAVAATDPHAVDSVRHFLELLADNEATCTLEYGDQIFAFRDAGEVRRGVQRLGRDNVHETQQELQGRFEGYLPQRRAFEFKLDSTFEVINGKVGPAIAAAETLNTHLHKLARIKVVATNVGNGKPRYVLIEQPRWLESS
jgi:hypothetical protein